MKVVLIALACALLVATGQGAPTGSPAASTSAPTDADILYFAYNLEIFEADFYSCIVNGTGVPSAYTGGGPDPIGCTQGSGLNASTLAFISELASEENDHVALLYTALKAAGVNPVAPLVNISAGVFNTAAELAAGTTLNPAFSPYLNDLFFFHGAFLFEDAGASGYIGALNSISSTAYRQIAAQIGATESYHSSLIRTRLYQNINQLTPYGLTVAQFTSAIVALENTITQAPVIKYNIFNAAGPKISNVDANALVPVASAQQVLRLVTLGAAAGSGGGFFPNNLNGNVKN